MNRYLTIFFLCAFANNCLAVFDGDLKPGALAPALEIRDWLKGEPIDKLDSQRTYVVEFWATWCGPCIESIPHISELAKKYEDIIFLGISVLEEPKDDNIKKFVEQMGEKMSYRVGYSGNKDGMAATWLIPALQDGLPTAYVVKDGLIQWIGHPTNLDKVLRQMTEGTFDLAASTREFETQLEATKARREANAAFTAVIALREIGQKKEAEKALALAVETYPRLALSSERLHYEWLAEDDPEEWLRQTNSLAASGKPENLQQVVSLALRLSLKQQSADQARTAIEIALRASEWKDWDVLLYARTVYLRLSDNEDSFEVTNRMLELVPTSPEKDNLALKEALQKSLAELKSKLEVKQ